MSKITLLLFSAFFTLLFSYPSVAVAKKSGMQEKPIKMTGETVTPTAQVKTAPKAKPADPEKQTAQAKPSSARDLDPNNPASKIYLDSKGQLAGTGDVEKSGAASAFAKIGQGPHPTALADPKLPKDKYNMVDWTKIVTEKLIEPKWSLDPKADPDDEEFTDEKILFESKGKFMADVIFPHEIHTWWLTCDTCHDTVDGAIFEMGAGETPNVTMKGMIKGETCGRCHSKVAFPLDDCKRCHMTPKGSELDDSITLRTESQ